MSRLNKWLFFFEEASEKRDVESWSKALNSNLPTNLNIIGLVSDRAKALIKLELPEYLDACSMPDLFHFVQDFGKLCGMQIGKRYQKAMKRNNSNALDNKSIEEKAVIGSETEEVKQVYESYKEQTQTINKTVHPFDESNNWVSGEAVKKQLLQSLSKISNLGERLNINIDLSRATKILNQIPDLVNGITNWIEFAQKKINNWVQQGVMTEIERQWFTLYLLPFLYWNAQLKRTKNSRPNEKLKRYYEQRMNEAKEKTLEQVKILDISLEQQNVLFEMAYQLANSFQRASSQVEGRNGYLAFIHHGQKGIPEKKLKVLTVIHNFDTRRTDGTTPAQRLYGKEFPDLFEFLCANVTGFKEPRKRKTKSLNNSILQP